MDIEQIYILDTTLRDGEQTPGFAFPAKNKIRVAKLLDDLGVDAIDVGFPAANKEDADTIKSLSKAGLASKLSAIVRSRREEIDLAVDSGAQRLILIIPTSDILLRTWMRKSREDAKKLLLDAAEYSYGRGVEVEVFMVDALRTPLPRLIDLAKNLEYVDAFTIADTVGSANPVTVRKYVSVLSAKTKSRLGVHFHNDLGLATSNCLEAILNGAREAHVTVAGIGERAGNAPLEQVAMLIAQTYGNRFRSKIKLPKLYPGLSEIAKRLDLQISPNKAIIGRNVFTHESDIHVFGTLTDPKSFEPFPPSMVGRESNIVFGKFTGSRSLETFLEMNRLKLREEEISALLKKIKSRTKRGGVLTRREVLRMAQKLKK